jgi:hypothetical protein
MKAGIVRTDLSLARRIVASFDRVRVRLIEELEAEVIDRLLAEVSPLQEAV